MGGGGSGGGWRVVHIDTGSEDRGINLHFVYYAYHDLETEIKDQRKKNFKEIRIFFL
jgi:hypothetical protein